MSKKIPIGKREVPIIGSNQMLINIINPTKRIAKSVFSISISKESEGGKVFLMLFELV